MSKVDGRKIPHPMREAIRHEAFQKWAKGSPRFARVCRMMEKHK